MWVSSIPFSGNAVTSPFSRTGGPAYDGRHAPGRCRHPPADADRGSAPASSGRPIGGRRGPSLGRDPGPGFDGRRAGDPGTVPPSHAGGHRPGPAGGALDRQGLGDARDAPPRRGRGPRLAGPADCGAIAPQIASSAGRGGRSRRHGGAGARADPVHAGRRGAADLARDWVGRSPALGRERALAEFASRFLAAHGPSAPEDLAYWSGLRATDVRRAWTLIADRLRPVETAGATRLRLKGLQSRAGPGPIRLLPMFDEYLLGWRSRDIVLAERHRRGGGAGGGGGHPIGGAGGARWGDPGRG